MKTTAKTPPDSANSIENEKAYLRFSLPVRFEHLLFLISFSLLGITGLPQKYATSPVFPVVQASSAASKRTYYSSCRLW
jgi:hypothetical protein